MNAGTVNNASSAEFKGNKADFECFAYCHHPTITHKKGKEDGRKAERDTELFPLTKKGKLLSARWCSVLLLMM